jgi:hypothetical protein
MCAQCVASYRDRLSSPQPACQFHGTVEFVGLSPASYSTVDAVTRSSDDRRGLEW